jgi:hypothetical protein
VDARNKCGHDELEIVALVQESAGTMPVIRSPDHRSAGMPASTSVALRESPLGNPSGTINTCPVNSGTKPKSSRRKQFFSLGNP